MSQSNSSNEKGSVVDLTYSFPADSTEALVVDFLNQDKTIRKHQILKSWIDYFLIEALFHKGRPLNSDMQRKAFLAIHSIEQRCQQLKQLYSTFDLSDIPISEDNFDENEVSTEIKSANSMDFGI
ncbi:MAG: hypothetical protein RLZZ574_2996 [Cyanobacteriota bacterium]|jgi:hypothetical protein